MSVPFPDKDFLSGHWATLRELARNTYKSNDIDDFANSLPDLSALDFDKVKNDICAYRGFRLCSVDAVTVSKNGRIFFIEFKDRTSNPRAELRKKAFDSLFLFWVAAGKSLTMDEIRDRALFCYISRKESNRGDDEFEGDLRIASKGIPRPALSDGAEDLLNSGLYGEVWDETPKEFSEKIKDVGVAPNIEEILTRIRVGYHAQTTRPSVDGVTTSPNFKQAVLPIAKIRVIEQDNPFRSPVPQQKQRRQHLYSCLFGAETYNEVESTVSFSYDWKKEKQRAMPLAAQCFDTFMLWCLAYHFKEKLGDIGSILYGKVTYKGLVPNGIPASSGSTSDFDCFREIFHTPCSEGHLLKPFIEQKLYKQIEMSA